MHYKMSISTLQGNKTSFSTILLYAVAIAGVGLVVYFGGEVIRNLDKLKGKSVLTANVFHKEAEIYVNDKFLGNTPVEELEVNSGENKITFKSGSRQYETTIEFIPRDNKITHTVGIFRDLGTTDLFSSGQEFWFEKEKSDNVIRIVTEPSGATVYIDNTEFGKTPFSSDKLSEGEYSLRIEYPGYESQNARINTRKNHTLNITLKLFPIPVPSKINAFEESPNLYDLSTDNINITSDTESWVKSIIYWNETRGINLADTGMNKEQVFDYFIDYKGNIYGAGGTVLMGDSDLASLSDAERGAYLGRTSDGVGLTKEARDAFEKLTGVGLGGKKAKILETGTGWLRVRDAAGLSGAEVAKVDVGNEYSVLEEGTGWVKIKVSDEIEGWISADYVELSE